MSARSALVACLIVSLPMFGDVYIVRNTSDAGSGSLREAITLANANPGRDAIHFNIAGRGPQTMHLATALPVIADPLLIDGYTQPEASAYDPSSYAIPVLRIVLAGKSQSFHGLVFSAAADGSVVRGLSLGNFDSAISIDGADDVRILANFIGIDPSGSPLPNFIGVELHNGASGCIVGGPELDDRNVISGNDTGIAVAGDNHVVENNLIGTRPDGMSPAPNATGVSILNGNGNGIGPGNVISGNTIGEDACGIRIAGASSSTSVTMNFIGIAVDGETPLPNRKGIWILDGDGSVPPSNNIAMNRIEHNLEEGIVVPRANLYRKGNTFAANGGLAIRLDDGLERRQSHPVLTSVVASGGNLTISGTLDALPGEYAIEFLHDDACDPSGRGQGRAMGVTTVNVVDGCVSFTTTFASPETSGVISATATSKDRLETSEISRCETVIAR